MSDQQHDNQSMPERIRQSQRGGVNLGAYNRIEQIGTLIGGDQVAGDQVAGDKFQIGTLQIITYTPPAQNADPEQMRFSLEQAYRSEVARRYAVWRSRYAPLPIQSKELVMAKSFPQLFEREELIFAAIRRTFTKDTPPPDQAEPTDTITFTDLRKGLRHYRELLLLGSPGGGKTTALWRLALDLAEDGLFHDTDTPLPILVRLGGLQEGQPLMDLLQSELANAALKDERGNPFPLAAHRTLAPLLPELLDSGRLVLLWDGLNEVPRTLFATTARNLDYFRWSCPGFPVLSKSKNWVEAMKIIIQNHKQTKKFTVFSMDILRYLSNFDINNPHNQNIITCRSEDYDRLINEDGNSDLLPFTQATIQGLEPESIQQIVSGRLGTPQGQMLLDELKQPQHRTLATLVRTPLLLTMLCEVYIATGSLPTNRGRLLQAFVDQRWDWEQQRYPDIWIDRAIQRQALARLAYAITESYGRGTSVSWEWAQLYLEESVPGIAIDQVRKLAHQADLLDILEDGKSIQFSHQLIQEYFAAIGLQFEFSKWIHLDSEATQTEIQKYAAPGRRTGWEETLLILAGIEGETGHARELIRAFLSQPVQAARLLLARGNDVDPSLVEEHRMYCLTKITDSNSTLSERIEAGQALGLVGDPRFPVTIDEWQKEIFQCVNDFNDSVVTQQHILLLIGTYWCRVHSGKYRIGGWEQGQPYTDINLSGFWIARFPITVAQFAPFVEAGYSGQAKDWWGPNGWKWKNETRRRHPARWDERSTNDMSQPVTGVTWYEAHAFCTWLNELTQNTLPKGYIIRLPTEAEWETAAAYDALMQRRSYPWGEEEPTPERVIYESSRLQMPTPVGCCPKGAAACGASDMVGNVWEITTSSFRNYPEQSHIAKEDFTLDKMYASHDWNVPWRGGSWWSGKPSICCMARDRHDPRDVLDFDNGFRVVLATALNSNS